MARAPVSYLTRYPSRSKSRVDSRIKTASGQWELAPNAALNQGVTISLSGLGKVAAVFQAAPELLVEAAYPGVIMGGEYILTLSRMEVPVVTGRLLSTSHMKPPVRRPLGVDVTFGYGGPVAPYAIHVHESLTARHTRPRKAKYLEDPLFRSRAAVTRIIRGSVASYLAGP